MLRSCFLSLGLLLAGILASACGAATPPASVTVTLNGAGATFPAPLYTQWFANYARVDSSVNFSYQATGSGDGIAQITAKSVDF
ncbi:MAG: phosphate ABC transporter substrate-binding protein PstS, partial [Anaerolineae bacterium]